nr:pentatricopeptide repeat-containing protein At4g04790, mitochondrial-like [Tanacetum cinerariifolium]
MNIVNDKVVKMNANLLEMALYLEEKFYPHLLTTTSGRRWLLTHGLKLVVKCLNSSEYLTDLGLAISCAIENGMQSGLSAGIHHRKAGKSLEDVVAYNHDADYNSAMQKLCEVDDLDSLGMPLSVPLHPCAWTSLITANRYELRRTALSLFAFAGRVPSVRCAKPVDVILLSASAILFSLLETCLIENILKPLACALTFSRYQIISASFAMYVPLTWLATNMESIFAWRFLTPISFAILKPAIKASYSASFPVPGPFAQDDPSVNKIHGSGSSYSTSMGLSRESSSGRSTMNLPATSDFENTCFIGWSVTTISRVLKNGNDFSPDLAKNLFKLASFPFNFCTSFKHFEDERLKRTSTLSGHTFIPLVLTLYPRNIPSSTPKASKQTHLASCCFHSGSDIFRSWLPAATSPLRKDVVILNISSTDFGILLCRRLITSGFIIPCMNPEILMIYGAPFTSLLSTLNLRTKSFVDSPSLCLIRLSFSLLDKVILAVYGFGRKVVKPYSSGPGASSVPLERELWTPGHAADTSRSEPFSEVPSSARCPLRFPYDISFSCLAVFRTADVGAVGEWPERVLMAKTLTKLAVTAFSDHFTRTATRSASTTTTATTTGTLANFIKLSKAVDSCSTSRVKGVKAKRSAKLKKCFESKLPSELAVQSVRVDTTRSVNDVKSELRRELSSILQDTYEEEEEPVIQLLDIPWAPTISQNSASLHRREVARGRKQLWTFNTTQGGRFGRLVRMCTHKLGANTTIKVFGKLDRETGVKEFNYMIEICIEKARNTDDEDVTLEEFHRAYVIFEYMRERGFEIGEETYGPFLMFIIDMGMIEEFHFFCDNIKKENPKSLVRLAYYEMLLWIKVEDEDKIQTLIANATGGDEANFNESYLVALCEGDRQEEVSLLLETIDIKKVSSKENMERIFKALGRLSLDSHAKQFILELKTDDKEEQRLSSLIYSYVTSIPNMQVEDVVMKFKDLQSDLEVASSSVTLEKLIKSCCDSLEVHLAIDLVDSMLKDGLTTKITTFNTMLSSCFASCEYNLVHRINSKMNDHDIKPNAETFRLMITLCVKMKDFDKAYGMINDLERSNLIPTANMYNAIMGGYFRQKNFQKGLMVLKQMDASNVKPDSHTFSYIIGNCNSEDDIMKYRKELNESGVQPTKHIFMALVNAYATCGLFEKAKQVLSDKAIPGASINEIKSVLVSALAANGRMAEALDVNDEIKQVNANLEPKATISLIEHIQSEGELSRLLQLLDQLLDSEFWDDGCARIILYCVRYKLLGYSGLSLCSIYVILQVLLTTCFDLNSPAVDLLKQRMERSDANDIAVESLFDEVFSQIAETEPTDVQFGLDLLEAIKDIGIRPSRRSLDFLFSACVFARDLERSYIVWKEYQNAGLPYNVLTSVRMYQALLASGAHKAAKILLENIPDDDPHVCRVLKACRETFGKSANELKGRQETSGKSTTDELKAFIETACKSGTVESGGKKKKNKRKKRK